MAEKLTFLTHALVSVVAFDFTPQRRAVLEDGT